MLDPSGKRDGIFRKRLVNNMVSDALGLYVVRTSANDYGYKWMLPFHEEDVEILVTREVICQWFSRVTKSRVKIIGKSPHQWPKKSLFTVTNVLFYFLHAILYLEHIPFRCKQWSIAHFAIVARDGLFWLDIVTSLQLICDVTRTLATGIVTSYSSSVLARANWRKGDLH